MQPPPEDHQHDAASNIFHRVVHPSLHYREIRLGWRLIAPLHHPSLRRNIHTCPCGAVAAQMRAPCFRFISGAVLSPPSSQVRPLLCGHARLLLGNVAQRIRNRSNGPLAPAVRPKSLLFQ